MAGSAIQFVSDEGGKPTSAIVPIALWHETESARQTADLLKSATMRRRLAEAKTRLEGTPFEEGCHRLGVSYRRVWGFGLGLARTSQKAAAKFVDGGANPPRAPPLVTPLHVQKRSFSRERWVVCCQMTPDDK